MAEITRLSSSNTTNYQGDGSAQTYIEASPTSYQSSIPGSIDRLRNAGIAPGGNSLITDIAGKVLGFNFNATDGSVVPPETDWRVRISMARFTAQYFYNNPNNAIMSPLSQTNGVIFPYTPQISIGHMAKYNSQNLTHSNYNSYFYENSEVQAIRINADFVVQNVVEGQYLMAVIQFFRTCTKMFFGNDVFAGTPPPLVFLNGYGAPYLPNVPCVVTQFEHTMPKEVDYVPIPLRVAGGIFDRTLYNSAFVESDVPSTSPSSYVALPTSSEITLALQPVYSRKNIADNFTLQKFGNGDLIENGNSPIGGFL
jgi:hypothetical protein